MFHPSLMTNAQLASYCFTEANIWEGNMGLSTTFAVGGVSLDS